MTEKNENGHTELYVTPTNWVFEWYVAQRRFKLAFMGSVTLRFMIFLLFRQYNELFHVSIFWHVCARHQRTKEEIHLRRDLFFEKSETLFCAICMLKLTHKKFGKIKTDTNLVVS